MKHTPALALTGLGDLGYDGETTGRVGGMAATPSGLVISPGDGFSFGYFVGQQGFANRLYRRAGDNSIHTPATNGRNWANHQSADPWHVIAPVSELNHAESSTALFRGKAVTVSIRRPGIAPSDMARTYAHWSNNDGETWGPATPLPTNNMQYTSDPVVDFTDDAGGTAIAVMIGVNFPNNECGVVGSTSRNIYYTTSTNGNWSAPSQLASNNNLDHPWVAVHRNPGGDDRIHVVWNDPSVKHITKLGNNAWSAVHALTALSGVPTVTVGRNGATYVTSADGNICRLNGTFDACESVQLFSTGTCKFFGSEEMEIPGSDQVLEVAQPWSVRASPSNGNRIYYAFSGLESGASKFDVYFSVLTYNAFNPPNMRFTCGPPVLLNAVANDLRDQFSPAVSVVGFEENGADFVAVNWYDRGAPHGDCLGYTNRCFRSMRSVSINSGLQFISTLPIPVSTSGAAVSDPALLPRHCRKHNIRFQGEYHETTGDVLHTMGVTIGVPPGSPDDESSGLFGAWLSPGYYSWLVPL